MSAVRKPDPAKLLRQASTAQAQHQHDEALAYAQQLLAHFPSNPQALLIAAQSCLMLERHEDAVDWLNRVLAVQPSNAIALNNRGVAFEVLGQHKEALKDFTRARTLEPDYEDALVNEAQCLQRLGRHEEALLAYQGILKLAPQHPTAQVGGAQALRAIGKVDEALETLRKRVVWHPQDGAAWSALGDACLEAGQWTQAVEAYGQASTLQPDNALNYANCGKALRELQQFEDALLVTDAAISIDPECLAARRNKVVFLLDMNHWLLAIEACHEVIKRAPADALTYNNLGFALNALKHHEAALDAFQQAVLHDEKLAVAWVNKACTLELMNRHEEALQACEQALRIEPDYPNLLGRTAHARLYVCDWKNARTDRQRITEAIAAGHPACDPFRIISFSDNASDQQAIARSWLTEHAPTWDSVAWPPVMARPHTGRIRIGYFSADYHHHATTLLMARMLELHDRSRFELVGISFGPAREDHMRLRLRKAFDSFHDVSTLDDDKAAHLARELRLDIAVDLKGHTLDHRIGLFRRRVAPVQISYLGFPGTLGGSFMDYILADHILIPDHLKAHYNEKVIRIPGTYQANDPGHGVALPPPRRKNLGLPDSGFVFCCFNNNYKITPEVFDVWMRLLRATPGSVLWLLADNDTAKANLWLEAERRGVRAERITFASRVSWQEHLARQRAADLFLDTLPCNAHTTASDALRVGLPVLTCSGTAFASRVAASLLHAQGLDDLITNDLSSYERLALQLAHSPELMRATRLRAQRAIFSGALLDAVAHVRAVEAAYTAVVERSWKGLGPADIDVPSSSIQSADLLLKT